MYVCMRDTPYFAPPVQCMSAAALSAAPPEGLGPNAGQTIRAALRQAGAVPTRMCPEHCFVINGINECFEVGTFLLCMV